MFQKAPTTRSAARSRKSNHNNAGVNQRKVSDVDFKQCYVRLTKLSTEEINKMIEVVNINDMKQPQTTKQDSPVKRKQRKNEKVLLHDIKKKCVPDRKSPMKLRQRKKEENTLQVTLKLPNKSAVVKKGMNSQQANKIWKDLVKMKYQTQIGDICLAKMRSYKPWPALILNNNGRTVYWVRFFGKECHGSVKKVDCIPFDKGCKKKTCKKKTFICRVMK